ncbi:RcnB family protein [Brucella pseudogrignonensis]|uniref:Ni/Co efflux regulator RcnB n=1 Tax=Brucella pseudogrignonensis TaxID=419475 RepID=A0ABU1M7P2_9HYPH|nr:RcnB family protein [Brucella pseudogrignonensis]MDR6432054.1 Ni/Co efflux regulator RcnB [Brucella pseudogrignonensis]
MIKKAILAAIALSFVGAPLAQAQNHNPPRKPGYSHTENSRPSHGKNFERHDRRDQKQKRWSRGERYGDWRRHQEIKDYQRYGLLKPGRGQHWVKVDNQYLLIAGATGLIAGILAAR